MNQIHYDFIRQRNEALLRSVLIEKDVQSLHPVRIGLRIRVLFMLSDLLIGIGAWIRPHEMRIFISDHGLDDCEPLVNCS